MELEFIYDPGFDDPATVAEILGPPPGPAGAPARGRQRAPGGPSDSLAGLNDVPLLSRGQERHLFRKMNYLRYRAHRLREALDPGRCDAAQFDEIERLQGEALAVKDQLIRANLRLVVSVAKRHVGPARDFYELVSDGNLALIRAVEKFDASRGFKFSTYATWAILRGLARSIAEARWRLGRFVTGREEMFEFTPDTGDALERESGHRRNREVVQGMLGRLDDRERRVLIGHYGIGGLDERTLEQLGRELGISKERVRQIESRAMEKLRRMAMAERRDLNPD